MAEEKLKLKLLVDSKTNRVVYAEAGKEFVDFLFHILFLPVGTVVQLLNVNGMPGSIGSIVSFCKSVESLDSSYFQPDVDKDVVLKTNAAFNVPLLKLNAAATPISYTIYKCGKCSKFASAVFSATCLGLGCQYDMTEQMTLVPSQNAFDMTTSNIVFWGYMKEMTTFMVMDNLEVKPLSTVSGLAQMNKLNVKDVSAIIEKEVEVGFTEVIDVFRVLFLQAQAILKASFEVTNTVLTSVFLSKKEK